MAEGHASSSKIRLAYEILLSLNAAYIAVFSLSLLLPRIELPLAHMEVNVNKSLHMRQTDLVRGYMGLLLSSLLVAVCIWGVFRAFSNAPAIRRVLNWVGGVVCLFAPAVFWFWGRPYGTRLAATIAESLLAVLLVSLYLIGKWHLPEMAGFALLVAHYAFWFWMSGNPIDWPPYPGTITPILGLPCALIWIIYRRQNRPGSAQYVAVSA